MNFIFSSSSPFSQLRRQRVSTPNSPVLKRTVHMACEKNCSTIYEVLYCVASHNARDQVWIMNFIFLSSTQISQLRHQRDPTPNFPVLKQTVYMISTKNRSTNIWCSSLCQISQSKRSSWNNEFYIFIILPNQPTAPSKGLNTLLSSVEADSAHEFIFWSQAKFPLCRVCNKRKNLSSQK